MQTFSWTELRPHNGTQHSAFEELCCQLASREAAPPGTTFRRLGTPDGGVEGYHHLPDGVEWGWQAKYVQSLDEAQLRQIDSSVERALKTHPNLKRLIICMPHNLADPRGENDSATDRWEKRVAKWQKWAEQKGTEVHFEKWADFEIRDRLAHAEHRGRLYYWFNKEVLTQAWFEQRAKESIADAGTRYTPELHVGISINDYYEALGRTPRFSSGFKKLQGSLLRAAQRLGSAPVPEAAETLRAELVSATETYVGRLAVTEFEQPVAIPFDELSQEMQAIANQVTRIRSILWDNTPPPKDTYQSDPFGHAQHELRNLSSAAYQLQNRFASPEAAVANSRCLLLTGSAGTGKTHLAADVNMGRIDRRLPSVLILGEKFTDRDPLIQIIELIRFPGSADEFLGALDAAAEAAGAHATILIDALNEGAGRIIWPKSLAGFLAAVRPYTRIAVGLSVRSTYESVVIPPHVKDGAVCVEHLGFGEKTFDAVTRFFSNYSIKLPGAPLAMTEFSNPLFLKLFCEGLRKTGIKEVPVGHEGITKIFSFYLDAVESGLKRGPAASEPPFKRLVGPYLERLAAAMAETAETWINEDTAYAVAEECATTMIGDNALLYHLIREGVLAKEMVYTGDDKLAEVVRFAYERVGDHSLAASMLAEADDDGVRVLFAADGALGKRLQGHVAYRFRGFLEAAMIQVPERFGFELIDFLSWAKGYERQGMEEAFLHSLVWRRSEAFTDSTWNSVRSLIRTSNEELLNVLLVIATRRGHSYNAEYLHRRLLSFSVAERDLRWTIPINQSYDEGTTTDLLTRWARSYMDSQVVESESARLLALTLTWFLASTHRILRDRSTKSLVRVLVAQPDIVPQLLSDFETCNDSFVLERLYAAVYGASMLIQDQKMLSEWALSVRAQVTSGSFPVSLLSRDYARGVVERAVAVGVPLPEEVLADVRPPYGSSWLRNVPTAAAFAAKAKFDAKMSDADRC